MAGVQVPLLPELDPPPAATRRSRFPDGSWPGISAVFAAVETAAGVPAVAVGKPEPYIFEIARSLLGDRQRMAIVGDFSPLTSPGPSAPGLMTILLPGGTTMPVRQRSWTWSWPISRRSPAEINRAPPEAPALKMTQP